MKTWYIVVEDNETLEVKRTDLTDMPNWLWKRLSIWMNKKVKRME